MEKIFVGSPRYFEFKEAISEDQLLYLIMDMPFECQLDCLKCYRRKHIFKDNLGFNLRKKTILDAKNLGARALGIPGEGEPLLYWDMTKTLIEYANNLNLTTLLYTNGLCLTEDIIQFLFDHDVSLVVSCDSFKAENYRKLTGGGDVKVIKENLKMAAEIYRSGVALFGGMMQVRMALISIVNQINADEMLTLKKWADKANVYFICNFPVQMGNAKKNWEVLVGNRETELRAIAQEYSDTHFGGITTPTSDGRCAALYHGIAIDTNGLVLPCPASVDLSVGCIGEATLSELREKALDYARRNYSPPCILRFNPNPEPREHDGVIIKSV
jgi:MoaA/NifB/PqqE/SkfB family radical SAM enzyme